MLSTKDISKEIVKNIVASGSYDLWRQKEFRDSINFFKIGAREQDRIFNELEVTALGYVTFFLEERLTNKRHKDNYVVYANVGELVGDEFLSLMEEIGVTDREMRLWRQLIDMRLKEYRSDMALIMKESSKWKAFAGKDKHLRPAWARIITLSINSMRHIKGEKVALSDDMWPIMRHWLISLEVELVKVFKEADLKSVKVLN